MADRRSIEEAIRQGLECSHVEVAATTGEFEALIVAGFRGNSRVRRHQMVTRHWAAHARGDHAMSMQTLCRMSGPPADRFRGRPAGP